MCQSYKAACVCGKHTAEIFFGNMVLDETSVSQVYCPECSQQATEAGPHQVWDNGWLLTLNMDIVQSYSSTFGLPLDMLTAEWLFDAGYVTWVGITPDDTERRNREREEIQKLAKTDMPAYLKAMKEWGVGREQRFSDEGWRKMQP